MGDAVRAVERTGRAAEYCPHLGRGAIRREDADTVYSECPPHVLAVIVGTEGKRPSEAWDQDMPTGEIFARIREALTEQGYALPCE